MSESNKVRVQFDFTAEALKRVDTLKEVTGATTRAEVIRSALHVYEWVVKEALADNQFTVTDKGGQVAAQFPATLLVY